MERRYSEYGRQFAIDRCAEAMEEMFREEISVMNSREKEKDRERKQAIENQNLFHMWCPLTLEMGPNYDYLKQGFLRECIYWFLRAVVDVVFPLYNRFILGLRIEGLEYAMPPTRGAVSVCNHVHFLDCTMIACRFWQSKVYYPTLQSNLEIPLLRHLISLLGRGAHSSENIAVSAVCFCHVAGFKRRLQLCISIRKESCILIMKGFVPFGTGPLL